MNLVEDFYKILRFSTSIIRGNVHVQPVINYCARMHYTDITPRVLINTREKRQQYSMSNVVINRTQHRF